MQPLLTCTDGMLCLVDSPAAYCVPYLGQQACGVAKTQDLGLGRLLCQPLHHIVDLCTFSQSLMIA